MTTSTMQRKFGAINQTELKGGPLDTHIRSVGLGSYEREKKSLQGLSLAPDQYMKACQVAAKAVGV